MNETQVLQNYSEPEKTAYLSVIASLASADREASQAEVEFLQQLSQAAGLSQGAMQQVVAAAQDSTNQSVQQNLDVLRGSELRYSLITDLISFARADGAYSNDEEAMVNKISSYLGINQQQQHTLENVVDQAAQVPHDASDPAKQGFLSGIGDKLSSVGIPKGALMTGLLGIAAPMILSRVMGGGRSSGGFGGGSTMGGLLGGAMGGGSSMGSLLGGLLGGGLLSNVLGGGQSSGADPYGSSYPQQGTHVGSGGLGSLMSILGGLGGQPNSAPRSAGGGGLFGGGMGSLLGGLFGGR
ncbi:TerB family tellurite resistance protein [Hymenobacter sp. GOD-10R]|uniref:TerB family tellurite resistance protein n=1 Tax=Hymenobacter sp. GOD-10R TaxID=3093922 RepID=UPI002D76BCAB|nr:TerB family tellurite resistance protein [Hymenobacter sp. GOD-10R]WRQ28451.1 TerB family tellurite resistance protein [Hymenobacter sp. GOD-10R]